MQYVSIFKHGIVVFYYNFRRLGNTKAADTLSHSWQMETHAELFQNHLLVA